MDGETPTQDASNTPAETLDATPAPPTLRLPTPPTPFIGREREVAEVCALLGRAGVRLLTLTGPGGIGKTRLALAVADAVRNEFPEGVCCVSLAGLSDASLVLPAIGQAMGLREASKLGGQPAMLDRLQDLIDHRKVLLVLDNFEQVIDAAAGVAALLSACVRLKVLVTSREVLRLSGEQGYPVPPMTLPDLQHLPPLEFLARVEAVRLFVTRAQAAQPDFMLTQANAAEVAAICHHLDGLPLAIELAASRIRLLSPVAMLARLERRLPWLTSGTRDAPARHQTLRDAIGWSYDLLERDEQQLFRRLSVFIGGCTLEGVAAVCNPVGEAGADETGLLEALASLVDKSLLRQEDTKVVQSRLYMLETIREYAVEQLAASGEVGNTRRAHARYYMALAEEAERGMAGPDQQIWLTRLEEEHDNLRAALAWTVESEPEIGARMAVALWRFWLLRGHLGEGQHWLDAILANKDTLPAALRAEALNGAGRLALRQGDYAHAEAILEESLALWGTLGDIRGEMYALNSLGLVAIYRSDFVLAQGYFERNLAEWRVMEDKRGTAQALNNLGLALRYQGDFERAARAYEECLDIGRELQDKYYLTAALHNLGQMKHHQGDDAGAHKLLTESLILTGELGDKPGVSVDLADLAGVWAAVGQPERAARLFGAAEALREQTGATMYESQRLAYERDLERGAAQMDADGWKAAWAEGRAMSLDSAYALAVEELPQVAGAEAQISTQNPYDLTDRELEVLRLLVAGLTYAEIAEHLTLSFHTVHAHLRSIYSKLGVTSRNQATRFAGVHQIL